MTKRFLCVLLAALLILGSFAFVAVNETKTKTIGDYQYRSVKGGIQIVSYSGSEAAPFIPAKIEGRKVVSIGEQAFCGSLSVEDVVIPESVTEICDYAFECCASLKKVSFPAALKTVGKGAFSGCVSLEEVSLKDGIESFGDGAFFFCRRLRSFDITSSVRSVGSFMFAECSSLGKVNIAKGLDSLSDRMFYNCETLSATDIPSSVTYIGRRAFEKCRSLKKIGNASGVETICEYAFDGDTELSSIEFSDKLSVIQKNAFHSCYGLTHAYIPASVEVIEPGAFMGLNLEEITVDEKNGHYIAVDNVLFTKDMSTLVLYPCGSARTGYVIPEGVSVIAPYAFRASMNLTSLTIPEGVKVIGEGAFTDAHNIAKLVIPDSVETLGDSCFYCTGFEEIVVGSGVTELGKNLFGCCYSLRNVQLPETLTLIGEMAFANCEGLGSITVPKNVVSIDSSAFINTLCPINIEADAFRKIGGMLYSADGKTLYKCLSPSDIQEYVIPDGVERVAPYAFDKFIKSVTVPDSVKEIGENAFGMFRNDYGEELNVSLLKDFRLFGSEYSAARAYALENDLSFFTAEPQLNAAEITLAGNETFDLVLNGAANGDAAFTSNDPSVATVDANGTITAHKAGTASVTAAVGLACFKCDVTVTSDGEPNENVFDDSGYTRLARGESAAWVDSYKELNAESLAFDPDMNPFTSAYKGENYYEGMWAAQVEDSEYDAVAQSMFGDDYRDQLAMMDHGLNVELARYRQTDDVVLFSGTVGFDRFLGKKASVKDIQNAVGTVITEPYFFSTALDQSVSHQFSGDRNCVFEIYADKDAVRGGYIECTVGQGDGGEYELLMPANARFEVLEAGVREVTTATMNPLWDPEEITSYERFMKVRLLDFSEAEQAEESGNMQVAAIIVIAALAALLISNIAEFVRRKRKAA